MNAPLAPAAHQAHQLAEALAQACDRIAPTWPLDRFIAVNPYWGWIGQPLPEAAARLGLLAGAPLTMPRTWFRAQWQAGRLQRVHLEAVARRHGGSPSAQELEQALRAGTPPLPRQPLVSALCDAAWPERAPRWSDTVTHQISQHCAAWFDDAQARWGPSRADGLYGGWLRQLAADRGLPWPAGRRAALARIAALPSAPQAAIAQALAGLGIAPSAQADYLTAALFSINGWAAWCAHARWQARLHGRDDAQLAELAAIRMAWELLLAQAAQDAGRPVTDPAWAASWARCDARSLLLEQAQRVDWRLQEAMELAYQQPLAALLARPSGNDVAAPAPQVQAVFCIDVRSERLRRAVEAADPAIHTRGFAGFFGLPVAWQPAGSALVRPQLPGLLAPALTLHDGPVPGAEGADGAPLGSVLAARRQQALDWRARWNALRSSAASGFSFVETCGLAYGAKLLADSLPSTRTPERWEDTGLPPTARGQAPRLPLADSDPSAATALLAGILRAMGLPDRQHGFAPLVLLAGHGSHSANNPHAAGLDCGACGGQTGEANARALAALLNTPALRGGLAAHGLVIPPGTHFLAALHDTTTDAVQLYDTDQVPAALAGTLAQLRSALQQAGQRTRAERAPALGLSALAEQPEALARALQQRANDWSQVRPEWGLADCAAFIVAPRARTRGLDLQGRAFLHDYDHRQDADLRVLELIMTAPMVVTNWINLQYHASTVDNRRFGSGNKLLHNVVGGHIGVFEGNGGDLRIGLPLQSLHDGEVLRHTPLRLSVFIEAPRAALETVIARHAVVRDLVDNGWLHLMRIDPEQPLVEQRRAGSWEPLVQAPWPARADAA